MNRIVIVAAMLCALAGATVVAAPAPHPHSIDYVIGMLEAGVPSRTVVARIQKTSMTFRLEEGDLDRLKAAGADDALVHAVETAATNDTGSPATSTQSGKGDTKTQRWSRPQRLAEPQKAEPQNAEPQNNDDDRQGAAGETQNLQSGSGGYGSGSTDETEPPHGGYPYYRPGDDDDYGYGTYYYGAPYAYYDPFFYPYYYPYYYSYYGFYPPYYRYYYGPHRYYNGYHSGRTFPRGSWRGAPRGGMSGPRSFGAPRGHVGPRGHR